MFDRILSPLNDVVFWMLASEKYKDEFLVPFLLSVLRIPASEYSHIEFGDPRTPVNSVDEKHGVVDVLLHTAKGTIIHIEVQLKLYQWMCERVVFYHSQNLGGQLARGEEYEEIRKTITILITGFELKEAESEYLCRYVYCNPETSVIFTEVSEIFTLDLTKIPQLDDKTAVWPWTQYFTAQKEEDLDMLVQNYPAMQKPVSALRTITADEKVRYLARQREKWQRDQKSMMSYERDEGRAEGKAEGRAEGKAEGRAEGRAEGKAARDMEIARGLIKKGYTNEMIADLLEGMPIQNIQSIRAE